MFILRLLLLKSIVESGLRLQLWVVFNRGNNHSNIRQTTVILYTLRIIVRSGSLMRPMTIIALLPMPLIWRRRWPGCHLKLILSVGMTVHSSRDGVDYYFRAVLVSLSTRFYKTIVSMMWFHITPPGIIKMVHMWAICGYIVSSVGWSSWTRSNKDYPYSSITWTGNSTILNTIRPSSDNWGIRDISDVG